MDAVARIARGIEQEKISELLLSDPGVARTIYLSALTKNIGECINVDQKVMKILRKTDRDILFDAITKRSPGPKMTREVSCPICGVTNTYPISLSDFLA